MSKNNDLKINVMMVGGRRCGKTSILASMQGLFEKTQVNTPLVINCANDEALDTIVKTQDKMKCYFAAKGTEKTFVPSEEPTTDKSEYPFSIGLKGKSSRICINFVDYPGEWLTTRREKVKEELSISRILLVAIDTPHLMEEGGIYNESYNRCGIVSGLIKDMDFAGASRGPGLILFIPLKCERYYNEGKMDEVNAKVREAYESMINYIRQPNANGESSRIAVAITPILTLGGAEFSRFERDENGNIRMNKNIATPFRPIYWFPDMSKDKPDPKYCEQPLLYVLSYVLTLAKMDKQKKKSKDWTHYLLDLLQTTFLNWPSAKDYLNQMEVINKQIKREGEGYSILIKGILEL